jgi:CDP-diacylglycerol--serine O-phosphatidyltransferase
MSTIPKLLKLKDYITLIGTTIGLIAVIVGSLGTRGSISFGFFLTTICLGTDLIDGYIARKTGTVNEMGKELDSLSDSLTFGIVPAVLTYLAFRTGQIFDFVLIIGCIIFALGALLRLARFNLSINTGYIGVPTPLSALLMIMYYFSNYYYVIATGNINAPFLDIAYYFIPFGMILLGWMNITTFIKFGEKNRMTYIIIIIIAPLSPIFGIIGVSNPTPILSLIISWFFILSFIGVILWVIVKSIIKFLAKNEEHH